LKADQRGVRLLAFSPDGKTLAAGTLDDPILLWDVPGPSPTGGAGAVKGTVGEVESRTMTER
jgi:WD40 repeat protein